MQTKAAPSVLRPPSQGDFNRMLRLRQRELEAITKRLASGEIDIREWGDQFDSILLNGHTQAWMMGRQRAGHLLDLGFDDQMAGIALKDTESEYLHGFMLDILNGRYTDENGKLKIGAINSRSSLYVGKMRGSANESWTNYGPDDQKLSWVMLALEHCHDCPRLASLSPWDKTDLWAYPGSGDTECLGNCKCILRREDGSESFRHPMTPANAPDIPIH